MKELFLNKTMNLIQQYHDPYTKEELELLRYGLEGIYLTITKLVIIVLLAFLLHMEYEVFLTLIFFNIIRFTGFGVHAGDSKTCLITSTINFIVIPYIFLHLSIDLWIQAIICGICLLSYLLYAPSDTVKRPLRNKKKRLIRKIVTVIIGIIYTLGVFLIPNDIISRLLLISLVIQMIVILPITYRILGQPYCNWKKTN